MTTSSVYVHLQRPDNGDWIMVGRYTLNRPEVPGANEIVSGQFVYAPSYLDAGYSWVIDPINLPRLDTVAYPAPRYGGLTDVLRDISPDAWGKLLLQREYQLSQHAHEFDYLMRAGNMDRWGALSVSFSKKPDVAAITSPRMSKLEAVQEELALMAAQLPAKYPELRKRLVKTPSLGGARPKATVQDGDHYWLVKPTIATDVGNVALLEYAALQWGGRAKFNMAASVLHKDAARTAVLVKRFDRTGKQRTMVVSGASLLETEYPIGNSTLGQNNARWSYSLLAQALRRIGVPKGDLMELFGRMLFNAMVGNDDDHPRNHAVLWCQQEKRWRLSPAFDVVPNVDDMQSDSPRRLAMQLSTGRWDIEREALMADWRYFGFDSKEHAEHYKSECIALIQKASQGLEADGVAAEQATLMRRHMMRIASMLA